MEKSGIKCIFISKNWGKKMQLKQFIMGGLLSTASLSALALIGVQQVQINNFKPFLVITVVVSILGVMAAYQKRLQRH